MSADKLRVARHVYHTRKHTTAPSAELLGVSRATLYPQPAAQSAFR